MPSEKRSLDWKQQPVSRHRVERECDSNSICCTARRLYCTREIFTCVVLSNGITEV